MPSLIPVHRIRNPEIKAYAAEAESFLRSHSWCRRVEALELAWAVAGIFAVFLARIESSRSEVDKKLWVVVGDLPPAYLVCDDAPTWREALAGYVFEMERWVVAVRNNDSLDDVIPVNVEASTEHAEALEKRLIFLNDNFILADTSGIKSDA